MKISKAALLLASLAPIFANAASNWTSSKIDNVTTYSDDRAAIRVSNYTNPNPADSVWNCNAGIVFLGSVDSPAPKGMLSAALTAQASGKPIRYGVIGSGSQCYMNYLTILE